MPMQAQCIARDIVQNIFIVVRTWFCVCAVAKGGKDRNENVVKRGKTCVLAPVGIFSLLFIFFFVDSQICVYSNYMSVK